MSQFVLHVPDIDEAGKDYAFTLAPDWIESHLKDAVLRADPAFGPGSLEVHAQENDATEFLVTGTLKAHLLTECGRCLGDAKVPVDLQFATLFTRGAGKKHPGHPTKQERFEATDEDDDDALQREEFSGYDIVLDDLVREYLVLEVPMQPLCSETCAGIPVPAHLRAPEEAFSSTGAVDPRLAPLQRLRDNVPPKPQPDPRPLAQSPNPKSAEKPNRKSGTRPDPNSEKE
jgi:uncharacterized protein